jgi:hypothetical protein
MRNSGRNGPWATSALTRHVPEPRSCSIGPRNQLLPTCSSPSSPWSHQLSNAVTHASNRMSTIRRNDSQPGPGVSNGLAPLVAHHEVVPRNQYGAGPGPINTSGSVTACWPPNQGHLGGPIWPADVARRQQRGDGSRPGPASRSSAPLQSLPSSAKLPARPPCEPRPLSHNSSTRASAGPVHNACRWHGDLLTALASGFRLNRCGAASCA